MTLVSFNRRRFLQVGAAGIAVAATGRRASAAETLPKQIRFFGNPADYGQPFTTGILGIAHSGGFLAKEFEKDDVELTFTYPAGSGPAINEAIANGQVDFARYGGFPHITGKSRGLPTKLLASVGIGHSYLVVRNGLDVKTVADLKGLRAAIGRGTAPHLAFIRVLEQHGLKESDVELFDLEGGDEIGAIASGAVDIGWGGAGFLKLAEDGNAKLIYTSKGQISPANNFGGFSVTEDFAAKYPETTQRVVNAYLKAAQFAAQPENFAAVLSLYEKAGENRAALEKDLAGVALGEELTPVIDDYFLSQFQGGIDFANENKLIRSDVDLKSWVDRSFIDKGIAELGLQKTWPNRKADGSVSA
ncbi:ABC transporter substrate-binding protein [Tianweitania populi]|uniref:Aryl sulfate ester ABC transporter n=1 Tax=Tianweitania populi TaxID=1607949 RepID=A0A8J3DLZ0_9HYPH|nr:ABC transporter substrate-binding protein [Tianweitania populi]GHD05148.1 aryl sulfate ester ABC transporter [Tianweitania populi]